MSSHRFGHRRFNLPTALAVTTLQVVSGCSDSETTTSSSSTTGADDASSTTSVMSPITSTSTSMQMLPNCNEVTEVDCTKCLLTDGETTCVGNGPFDCYYDQQTDSCEEIMA